MHNRNAERSLGELFSELATETTTLVRQELRLAKIELGRKASEAGKDVTLVVIGGAVTYAGVLAIVAAVVLLIGILIPMWLSALIVGIAVAGIGYVLSQNGVSSLRRLDPTPHTTLETLRADKEWVKEQMR